MARFEIDGTEYEVKITVPSIKEVNKLYDSPLEFVGEVLSGSYEAFINVLYIGLMHTDKGFNRARVETEVEKKLNNQQLDLQTMMSLGYEVINESFFFKKTVNKLMSGDPQARKQFENLMMDKPLENPEN